ncbi:cyclo(L-tyrosyl-L-tyrosyl) synthase [Saccharopolyspora spinosa]|uniref:Cyclodipeptide synthase n=2 Tax=Saccharopolyspora spinosa TaxID=60894 RepID=A0A2N3Y0P1_SACSN|nr:cyclo(L-tyrosyl-L-tyrosyl) synthase [Saccharopolyspora spinosa]
MITPMTTGSVNAGRQPMMRHEPATEESARIFQRRRHALVGTALFNSYFKQARLDELLRWAVTEFESVHVFLPDTTTAFTMQARGYPAVEAERKTRREARRLRGKICGSLAMLGVASPEQMIIDFAWLNENEEYLRTRDEVAEVFGADEDFRKACLAESESVARSRRRTDGILTEEELNMAARYLLAEIPLFVNAPAILGMPETVFCYHRIEPFERDLYRGAFALKAVPRQGWVVVESASSEMVDAGAAAGSLPRPRTAGAL